VVQFVHQEIRVLDYIEGQGQVLGYYTQELHHRGYDKVLCTLPHDGTNTNAITGLKYADHLRDTGFSVNVAPNQGAAAQRIKAVRRLLPKCWFNEATTKLAEMRWAATTRKSPSTTGQAMRLMRSG
jgi:phage terminase large subunit